MISTIIFRWNYRIGLSKSILKFMFFREKLKNGIFTKKAKANISSEWRVQGNKNKKLFINPLSLEYIRIVSPWILKPLTITYTCRVKFWYVWSFIPTYFIGVNWNKQNLQTKKEKLEEDIAKLKNSMEKTKETCDQSQSTSTTEKTKQQNSLD